MFDRNIERGKLNCFAFHLQRLLSLSWIYQSINDHESPIGAQPPRTCPTPSPRVVPKLYAVCRSLCLRILPILSLMKYALVHFLDHRFHVGRSPTLKPLVAYNIRVLSPKMLSLESC